MPKITVSVENITPSSSKEFDKYRTEQLRDQDFWVDVKWQWLNSWIVTLDKSELTEFKENIKAEGFRLKNERNPGIMIKRRIMGRKKKKKNPGSFIPVRMIGNKIQMRVPDKNPGTLKQVKAIVKRLKKGS